MAANYVLLEKIVVGAVTPSSVTFNSIPQTGYTDLVVRMSTRSTGSSGDIQLVFNGSGGTAYSGILLYGTGGATASASSTGAAYMSWGGGSINRSTTTGSIFASGEIYIPNYTSANYKTVSTEGVEEDSVATTVYSELSTHTWANTAAITSLTLTPSGSGSFAQYSTFYLYGIANSSVTPAIAPYATGGDEIMLVGSYWYHIFSSNGTFAVKSGKTPTLAVTACGGGGGSGFSMAGGGGGGELDIATSVASATGSYTVTVGSAGIGIWNVGSPYGTNGGTSTFVKGATTYVSSLGGGAAGMQGAGYTSGVTGGSGGGGNGRIENGAGGGASGSNTNVGGSGYYTGAPIWAGGGGGGATAAGGNASSTKGGDGGQGYALSSIDANLTAANFASFSGMTYISSGAGGASGLGTTTASTSGTGAGLSENNTTSRQSTSATSYGSGAGGVGGVYDGAKRDGFQGVVIVRYAV